MAIYDSSGVLYIADSLNNKLKKFVGGYVSTVAVIPNIGSFSFYNDILYIAAPQSGLFIHSLLKGFIFLTIKIILITIIKIIKINF